MNKAIVLKYFAAFLLASLVTTNTHSDDLDIYRSASGSSAQIMFVIDASGSMLLDLAGNDIECGKAPYNTATIGLGVDLNAHCFNSTRMKVLQDTFATVISGLKQKNDIGVGLTWFGGPMGGGIKFPIRNIKDKFDFTSGTFSSDRNVSTDVGDVVVNMVNGLFSYKDYTDSNAMLGDNSNDAQSLIACAADSRFNTDSGCDTNPATMTKFNTLRADTARMLTPTVDALYETARYFRGDYALYGSLDKFTPWDPAKGTYKLAPEKQTIHSLTEFWHRYKDTWTYANQFEDLIPDADLLVEATPKRLNKLGHDPVDITGIDASKASEIAGETGGAKLLREGDTVLGTATNPYKFVAGQNHRTGPLLGWRAANPLAFSNPAVSTRTYLNNNSTGWSGSDYEAEPPVLFGFCGYRPYRNTPSGLKGAGWDLYMKSMESWYRCNLKDDPASNQPTFGDPISDWGIYDAGNGSKIACNVNLSTASTFKYDRTLAQFFIDLLLKRAEAESGYSGGGSGSGGATTNCFFKYESEAKYESPLGSCSKGAIVLISDGRPTANTVESRVYYETDDNPDKGWINSEQNDNRKLGHRKHNPALVKKMIMSETNVDPNCASMDIVGIEGKQSNYSFTVAQDIGYYGTCGPELTEFLRTNDQRKVKLPDGYGTVDTYTVGFALGDSEKAATDEYMKGLSNGKHYSADTAAKLLEVMTTIVDSITVSENDEASAPTITLDRSSLSTANETYIPMFKPIGRPSWVGNIKGYELNNGMPDLTAQSFWSTGDAGDINLGGLNQWIKANGPSRVLYVTLDDAIPAGDLTIALDENNLTKNMIGLLDTVTDPAFEQVITDFRGSSMADSLHSKPVLVEYANKKVLFATSNRGLLHAFDVTNNTATGTSGQELWGFMPFPAVKTINHQVANVSSNSDDHIYTLDSQVQVWYHDPDRDGINSSPTDTGDHVYLYFGMRRGGAYHYAMNVTDPDRPKLMWKIKAGDTDFVELGDTWSPINLIRVDDGSADGKVVAVFGGGYRTDKQDDHTSTIRNVFNTCTGTASGTPLEDCKAPDGLGVYMIDAETGTLINSIGPGKGFTGTAAKSFSAVNDDMKYAIPSELRAIDSDGDGFTDRLYFGDMGGQLWKVNINTAYNGSSINLDDSNVFNAERLADFGVDSETDVASVTSHRRFYYPPAVAMVSKGKYVIAIGSGHRSSPMQGANAGVNLVQDSFYVVYDYDSAPTGVSYPVYHNTLADVTDTTVTEASAPAGWRIALKIDTGWEGEKNISSPFIFDNKVMFLTFIPQRLAGAACTLAGTQNLFYSLNLTTATSAIEVDPDDPNKDNRGNDLKPGKANKTVSVIPTGARLVDSINMISTLDPNKPDQECNAATAGTTQMAEFCNKPYKVYWKETK